MSYRHAWLAVALPPGTAPSLMPEVRLLFWFIFAVCALLLSAPLLRLSGVSRISLTLLPTLPLLYWRGLGIQHHHSVAGALDWRQAWLSLRLLLKALAAGSSSLLMARLLGLLLPTRFPLAGVAMSWVGILCLSGGAALFIWEILVDMVAMFSTCRAVLRKLLL